MSDNQADFQSPVGLGIMVIWLLSLVLGNTYYKCVGATAYYSEYLTKHNLPFQGRSPVGVWHIKRDSPATLSQQLVELFQ